MSPLARFVLPALAAAGLAYADCSANPTATIQNGGDASAIATCTTFKGSIAIATGVADTLNLSGVKKIDGDLEILTNNSALTSLSADSLEEISGAFKINGVTALGSLSMPKLATVDQINWVAVSVLRNVDWKLSKATSIKIDNTQMQDLKGLELQSIKNLYIANNAYISEISMMLQSVGESLELFANNPEVKVSFPNMAWAYNMTYRNCSSVDLPSLESVNSSIGFYGTKFETASLPNLTTVGGALVFASNMQLTNLSLPVLEKIGADLRIANNTKLTKVENIPKLASVGGGLDIYGNMSSIKLSALNDVRGTFNIQSTDDLGNSCDPFKTLHDNKKIQGKYFCDGKLANAGGQGTTPSKTGSGASKTGAASTLNVQSNAAMGLMGILAAIFM